MLTLITVCLSSNNIFHQQVKHPPSEARKVAKKGGKMSLDAYLTATNPPPATSKTAPRVFVSGGHAGDRAASQGFSNYLHGDAGAKSGQKEEHGSRKPKATPDSPVEAVPILAPSRHSLAASSATQQIKMTDFPTLDQAAGASTSRGGAAGLYLMGSAEESSGFDTAEGFHALTLLRTGEGTHPVCFESEDTNGSTALGFGHQSYRLDKKHINGSVTCRRKVCRAKICCCIFWFPFVS